MAVRSSMVALIAQARSLIGDMPQPQDLSGEDIQDVLDGQRREVRYELLSPMPDIQPGQNGQTTANFVWASYQSDFQYWESDVVLQGLNVATGQAWVLLTPATFEYIPGKWTMAVTLPAIATPPGQYPPVWATGKVYDLYAACAVLLERRIALRSLTTFDFSVAGGISAHISQVLGTWWKLRDSYQAKAWVGTIELVRADLAPDLGGRYANSNRTDSQAGLLPGVLGANVTGGEGQY